MSELEIELIKYTKKTWAKSGVLGFIIGLAVIVPGISGSTVAIIFKLYDQFLYAVGNLFKKFKACFLFLLPIGIGLVAGFLLGLIGVQKLLEVNMFAIVSLFAGLMVGAFPAVKDEIKGAEFTAKRVVLFVVGLIIPVLMGGISALNTAENMKMQEMASMQTAQDIFAKVQVWQVILAVVFGFIVGITQIVPGLSASAFLMTVAWYNGLMSSVSMTYWNRNGNRACRGLFRSTKARGYFPVRRRLSVLRLDDRSIPCRESRAEGRRENSYAYRAICGRRTLPDRAWLCFSLDFFKNSRHVRASDGGERLFKNRY